ncbi:MAG: ATP phosphoribosyltransferase [SAR202 cluster bacterium]|nr:ATP phosphoribosyltransferase [SAR202 cluster bacterium]
MTLRFGIPSDGALHDPTLRFLKDCGVDVTTANPRAYTGQVRGLPAISVHFLRGGDIPGKIEEGSIDCGITGLDRYEETHSEASDTQVILPLGFGHCELVLAVPDSWVDVASVADLADLSLEFRRSGRDLRVATKAPRLVERFLFKSGVAHFALVHSSGTLEAAPSMGYADIIADISSSGTTLRENRLKPVHGGTIIKAQAVLIANRGLIVPDGAKLDAARTLIELIEGYLQSRDFFSITANLKGETPDEVAKQVLSRSVIAGLRGPTIARVHARGGEGWYAATIVVAKDRLMSAVDSLRQIGGSGITVSRPSYVFHGESSAYTRLLNGARAPDA